jgi:hypothetical protein
MIRQRLKLLWRRGACKRVGAHKRVEIAACRWLLRCGRRAACAMLLWKLGRRQMGRSHR